LAVECPLQSGTLITCDFAKKLGRRVMAIPANLDSKSSAGCWRLIREGATMVTSARDVALAVADAPVAVRVPPVEGKSAASKLDVCEKPKKTISSKTKPKMTLEESTILKAIPSIGITLERLAFVTKLPAANVADAAMSLRLKNLLRFLPGNRVAPAKEHL
jgi:DNA processing protein